MHIRHVDACWFATLVVTLFRLLWEKPGVVHAQTTFPFTFPFGVLCPVLCYVVHGTCRINEVPGRMVETSSFLVCPLACQWAMGTNGNTPLEIFKTRLDQMGIVWFISACLCELDEFLVPLGNNPYLNSNYSFRSGLHEVLHVWWTSFLQLFSFLIMVDVQQAFNWINMWGFNTFSQILFLRIVLCFILFSVCC